MINLRPGRKEDYNQLLESEAKAWGDSGVKLISQDVFNTWLNVFPEGLIIAEVDGVVCGHIFSQICNFDPFDRNDNRNWDEMTDYGYSRATHNPNGNTLYTVSISSSHAGAGTALLYDSLDLCKQKGLKYFTGACRMPGVTKYAFKLGKEVDEIIEEYLKKVLKISNSTEGIFDPTLSVIAKIRGLEFIRVIPNYFDDPQSNNYACVLAFNNQEIN